MASRPDARADRERADGRRAPAPGSARRGGDPSPTLERAVPEPAPEVREDQPHTRGDE